MNSFYGYLIEANLCLLIFGAVYFLLLRKETDFKFRRYYLVMTGILTLLAPLLHISLPGTNGSISEISTTILPTLNIGEVTSDTSTFNSSIGYVSVGYWVVAGLIAQLFVFQLMQLAWFTFSKKTSIRKNDGIYIIYTNGTLPTFSFFNLLFFDNTVKLTSVEQAKIMYHEMIHIKQMHSADIILLELLKIGFWFNPIAWFIRREIQDIHEYLADSKVIENTDAQQYTSLLAKMALTKAHLSLGHHFNKSKTLKRIKMMNKTKQNIRVWKTLLLIPIIGLTLFAVSCNDEVMQDVDTVMETASQAEMPDVLQPKLTELQNRYPDADFVYMEADGNSKQALENLQDLDPNSIGHMRVFKDENKVGILVNKNGPMRNMADTNGVFTIVDEPASPEGGLEAFYQRLSETLKYPKQARKLGVEGKVYVQFIVNETGELTNMEAVKGIGAGCDAAAIDAIQKSGRWSGPRQAGKAVKQRIVLPISFSLGADSEEVDGE